MRTIGLILAVILAQARAVTPAVVDLTMITQTALATAQTATGVSANEADFGMGGLRGAALFQMRNTAGTATVELQVNCLAGTADYAPIPGSSTALTVSTAVLDVIHPGCRYRANVTACSGCNVTVTATSTG